MREYFNELELTLRQVEAGEGLNPGEDKEEGAGLKSEPLQGGDVVGVAHLPRNDQVSKKSFHFITLKKFNKITRPNWFNYL